jgi:hypothetical protein
MSIIKYSFHHVGFPNKEEELHNLLLMEINFLNCCLKKAEDEIERDLITFGIKKLENLQKIFFYTSRPLTSEDYDNFLRFIYETIMLITNELSNR